MGEVVRVGIDRPSLLALTKFDDADPAAAERFATLYPGMHVVTTSVLDDASLARLKSEAWRLTGLIRVHTSLRRSPQCPSCRWQTISETGSKLR